MESYILCNRINYEVIQTPIFIGTSTMIEYRVNDMTCGHCVSSITKAVQQAVPGVTVDIDLEHHLVRIDASPQEQMTIENAIREAGYRPER